MSSSHRASTAQVDLTMLHQKLAEIEDGFFINSVKKEEESANTVEYDLTKHVLSYLPTPVIPEDKLGSAPTAAKGTKKMSKKVLQEQSKFLGLQSSTLITRASIFSSIDMKTDEDIDMDPEFDSMFSPNDMRLLALVSHNNMKNAMKQFVLANMNALKKFRLTGTNTTMKMLREVFKNDPEVVYGPSCKSGPLGGDAQLVAMVVTGQLGGCIFFIDPMDSHPHSADIECLVRQGNVHNILMMCNPTSAHMAVNSLRVALKMGRMEMAPSFFFDLESPSVEAYKQRQNAVLQNAIQRVSVAIPPTIKRVLAPTREGKVKMSMVRALKVEEEFKTSGIVPVIEEGYEDDDSDIEMPVDRSKLPLGLFCGKLQLLVGGKGRSGLYAHQKGSEAF